MPKPACWPCGKQSKPGTPPRASHIPSQRNCAPFHGNAAGFEQRRLAHSPVDFTEGLAAPRANFALVAAWSGCCAPGNPPARLRSGSDIAARNPRAPASGRHEDSRSSGAFPTPSPQHAGRPPPHPPVSGSWVGSWLRWPRYFHQAFAGRPRARPQRHRDRRRRRLNRHANSASEECNTQANLLSCCF